MECAFGMSKISGPHLQVAIEVVILEWEGDSRRRLCDA